MPRFTVSFALLLTVAAAACVRSNRCQPGITIACACTSGATGAQVCGGDSQLGPCVCTDPAGGGGGGDVGNGAGGSDGSVGSDGGAGDSDGGDAPGGPMVVSFGASAATISMNQSITFTAIVTHPDGLADLAGGSLTTADGRLIYGSFAISGQALTLTLSWTQIDQTLGITFSTSETRTFDAVFFDRQGRRASATTDVTLACGGPPACQGVCLGSIYPLPKGCAVDWLPAATPSTCDAVCAGAGRQCTPSCASPNPDNPAAAAVAHYKNAGGDTLVEDTISCSAVPPTQETDPYATWTYVDQTCCCY